MGVTLVQVYLCIFVILAIGMTIGYFVGKANYEKTHWFQMMKLQKELEHEKTDKMKLIANQKHEISRAISNEWNRGYNAAFERLKYSYMYIRQWEQEHGMSQGEMETSALEFEKLMKEKESVEEEQQNEYCDYEHL